MVTSNDIFPPFSTIQYLYDNNAYTDLDIYTFVGLECLTKEQYREITGNPFPQAVDEPTNINVHAHSYQATIEAE